MTVHDGFLLHHPVVSQFSNRVFQHPKHPNTIIKAPKTAPPVRKIYGENTSDNSDYGELRAIVRRIEMNQNESPTSDNQLLENLDQNASKYDDLGRNASKQKQMVFDYQPASVMMKK